MLFRQLCPFARKYNGFEVITLWSRVSPRDALYIPILRRKCETINAHPRAPKEVDSTETTISVGEMFINGISGNDWLDTDGLRAIHVYVTAQFCICICHS